MLTAIFLGLLTLSTIHALPATVNEHLIHERVRSRHPRWEKRTEFLRRDVKFPMRIALAQQNLHKSEEFLMQVSNPASSVFGQYWTHEKITDVFAPSAESLTAVTSWLTNAGVSADRISHSPSGIVFNITVGEAELLLQTQYHVYVDTISREKSYACDHYSVPGNVRSHIDFITPTIALNPARKGRRRALEQPHEIIAVSSLQPKLGATFQPSHLPPLDLSSCDSYTIPDCLRALYGIPEGTTANPQNSFGIYAQSPNQFFQSNLDIFFRNFSPPLVGRPPKFVSIDGGEPFNPEIENALTTELDEGDLDLSYAMSLTFPLNVTIYQVGDNNRGGSYDLFLDALDASYCTFEGGDDPALDPTYPDPVPNGFNHTRVCGGVPLPKVISFSYESDEFFVPDAAKSRLCHEFMKLGLQGVSVLFASGDAGVGGNAGCLDPSTDGTTFNPEFPATCPYITAVGGTQINPGSSVSQPESALENNGVSGGGFSNFFAMPSYQKQAVLTWFSENPPNFNSSMFNNTKTTRGYPDVSANGNNYLVGITEDPPFVPSDILELVGGTSASVMCDLHRLYGFKLTIYSARRLLLSSPSSTKHV
jgi:tripeptidyl-peptidase-1